MSTSWPPLSYVWAAVLGSAVILGLLRLVYDVRAVFVLLLFGVLFALVLVYPLNLLARFLPRGLATLIIAALVIGSVVVSALLLAPFFANQLHWLIDRLPTALNQARRALEGLAPASVQLPGDWEQSIGSAAARLAGRVLPVAFDVLGAAFGVLAVIALALFLAYDGGGALRSLLRVVPRSREAIAREFVVRAGGTLQRWMLGQLAAMTVTGLLTGAGLFILGVDSWLVLAVLSFVFEFVPYIGPTVAAIPGILTGLAMSPQMGLWAAAVYVGVQSVESYVLQPLIMKNAIRIHPALLLVWQLAIASAFGLLGVFVATPLLACLHVAIELFYVERQLGKPAKVQ